jgi:hypothetical protein
MRDLVHVGSGTIEGIPIVDILTFWWRFVVQPPRARVAPPDRPRSRSLNMSGVSDIADEDVRLFDGGLSARRRGSDSSAGENKPFSRILSCPNAMNQRRCMAPPEELEDVGR